MDLTCRNAHLSRGVEGSSGVVAKNSCTPHTSPEKIRLCRAAVLASLLGGWCAGRRLVYLLCLVALPLPALYTYLRPPALTGVCTLVGRQGGSWVHALSRAGWMPPRPPLLAGVGCARTWHHRPPRGAILVAPRRHWHHRHGTTVVLTLAP